MTRGFLDDVLPTLERIAPTLAAALGGPLAGLAVTQLERVLGLEPGRGQDDPQALPQAIAAAAASPETVLALRREDDAFRQFCLQNRLDTARLEADDRASARARETALRDRMPGLLALLVTGGFFGMLGLMAFRDLPAVNRDLLTVMLGSLGAAWVAVVSYYFGSSAGSSRKDETIRRLAS